MAALEITVPLLWGGLDVWASSLGVSLVRRGPRGGTPSGLRFDACDIPSALRLLEAPAVRRGRPVTDDTELLNKQDVPALERCKVARGHLICCLTPSHHGNLTLLLRGPRGGVAGTIACAHSDLDAIGSALRSAEAHLTGADGPVARVGALDEVLAVSRSIG